MNSLRAYISRTARNCWLNKQKMRERRLSFPLLFSSYRIIFIKFIVRKTINIHCPTSFLQEVGLFCSRCPSLPSFHHLIIRLSSRCPNVDLLPFFSLLKAAKREKVRWRSIAGLSEEKWRKDWARTYLRVLSERKFFVLIRAFRGYYFQIRQGSFNSFKFGDRLLLFVAVRWPKMANCQGEARQRGCSGVCKSYATQESWHFDSKCIKIQCFLNQNRHCTTIKVIEIPQKWYSQIFRKKCKNMVNMVYNMWIKSHFCQLEFIFF